MSKAISRRISFLTERDTKRLCSEPIAGKVKYRGNALALIYRLTAGQPFYTQVVCQNLVDLLNEKQKNIVTIEILNEIIEEIVNNPLPQMIYFWDSLDDNEKVVLSLMSVSLTDDQETIIPAKIRRSISKQKYNIFISLSTINETFEKLFQNDLLAKPAQDEYNFRVDLFRHWIKYEHSVWQVVREISDSFRRPIVRPVIWYMSAIVLLMGLLGYFLFYQGFPQPKEKINNAKPMHYSAMIISNIGGVQVSLDSAKYITYTEGTIRFDSLQIGLHHADIYPPDSTWEPDRKRLKMFIKKEMQIFRVDFSKRSEELLISEIPEATLENKSKQIQHSKGSISLVSIPLGAKIYIEDEYKGETPFTLQSMTPGYHQFLLRKVGYSDVIKVIEIVADSIVLLNETLLELQGQLSVTVTGTWANIEIDGISYGRTPRRDPIILRAGIVEVKLLNPAYKPLTRSIEIAPEKEFKLVVDKKMFSDF
ncbi:PEGA domain-containing protein [bacterium]|nr:PEGA domain-containing protein [bacterium]